MIDPGTSIGSMASEVASPLSILVAEDDRDQSEMLCETLRDQGYEVCAAFTGSEAVRLAHSIRPALLILDLQLPECSGIQVLEDLRKHAATQNLEVVVVSSYSTHRDPRLAELKVKASLAKPIEREELLEAVRR